MLRPPIICCTNTVRVRDAASECSGSMPGIFWPFFAGRNVSLSGNVPGMISPAASHAFRLKQGEASFTIRALMDVQLVELFIAGGRAMISAFPAILVHDTRKSCFDCGDARQSLN